MVSAIFAMAATILAVSFYGLYAVITCNNDKNRIVKEQKARIHGK